MSRSELSVTKLKNYIHSYVSTWAVTEITNRVYREI